MKTADLIKIIRTPNKYGKLLLSPSYRKGEYDSHAVDCPFLFCHEGVYYMTFVGWDGIGYQTGLASSNDLLSWKKEGIILGRGGKGTVTEYNAALTCILRDNDLYGTGTLKRVKGHFVGTYHAYPQPGHEAGPAVIGLCFSADLREWEVSPPALRPDPAWNWESGGLYKSWLLESDGTYYLFYNAKNRTDRPWVEQIGVATSHDLKQWTRFPGNPLLSTGPEWAFDDLFASDPCVLKHQDIWIMFYFGNSSDGHARDGAAFSYDLIHWEKATEILIDVGPDGSIDSKYAHKPGIITKDGHLYHFYCAVSPVKDKHLGEIIHNEVRGISVATN